MLADAARIRMVRLVHACMLSRFSCVGLFTTLLDHSSQGSSVHGILQARILEWVAISFSPIGLGLNIMTSFNLVHVRAKVTSVVSDCATLWTIT